MTHRSLLAAVVLLLCQGAVSAQWISHRSPGVPRLANGRPNLKAAAPRSRDGHPYLSGIWYLHFDACSPFGCADYQAGPEFFNFGATLPGGLPYQPWAAALVKERMAAFAKIIQTPNLVVILSERDVTYRQLFVDGRTLPADPEPTWNGYSAGRWEGDALVIESNGFRDDTWIDRNGSPLTSAARVTERFRRPDYGHLQIEITVNDAKAYTRPWTVTLAQDLVVDTELLDYHCTDNDKGAARGRAIRRAGLKTRLHVRAA